AAGAFWKRRRAPGRHRDAHAPCARARRRPGNGEDREAEDGARQDRAPAAGSFAVKFWIALALALALPATAQEKAPPMKKKPPVKQAVHKKATPEQIRKFNELQKKRQ